MLPQKYYCSALANRTGCTVIVTLEFIWYSLNLFLCSKALAHGIQGYVLRLDYYRRIETDWRKI